MSLCLAQSLFPRHVFFIDVVNINTLSLTSHFGFHSQTFLISLSLFLTCSLSLSLSHSFLAIIICHLEAFLRRRISDESAARRRRGLRSFTISNDLQRPVTIRRNYS